MSDLTRKILEPSTVIPIRERDRVLLQLETALKELVELVKKYKEQNFGPENINRNNADWVRRWHR